MDSPEVIVIVDDPTLIGIDAGINAAASQAARIAAETGATIAVAARDAAISASSGVEAAKTQAQASATSAATKATQADTSATTALTAKIAAEAAKTAAETARTAAETARSQAASLAASAGVSAVAPYATTASNAAAQAVAAQLASRPAVFLPAGIPLLYWHRGGENYRTEGSLAAYGNAYRSGVVRWETDIHPTLEANGSIDWVMGHDDTWERMGGPSYTWQIKDRTLAESQAVNIGYGAPASPYPVYPPSLRQFLRFAKGRACSMILEVKVWPYGTSLSQITQATKEVLDIAKAEGVYDLVIWNANNLTEMQAARAYSATLPIAYLPNNINDLSTLVAAGGPFILLLDRTVWIANPTWVSQCLAVGIECGVYTITVGTDPWLTEFLKQGGRHVVASCFIKGRWA